MTGSRAEAPAAMTAAPLWAVLLWAAILLGLPALVTQISRPSPHPLAEAVQVTRSRPSTPPPLVDPVEVLQIAPEVAREVNAAIPFSTEPNPAARPFRFAGDAEQESRAIDCLAAAQLYEAGDDPSGQKAVAQVVLNRLRHPAFPKSICAVVFQGAERKTGCQFTFTCDGALDRMPTTAAWDRARALAQLMLSGAIDTRVGYATHYHTNWVVPYWSSSLDKITSVDTHLFFRWKGWWGTPPAFRHFTIVGEPAIAKLASISLAHRMASDGTAQSATSTGLAGLPDFSDLSGPAMTITRDRIGERFGAGRLSAINSAGNAFVMLIDRSADPTILENMAKQLCAGRKACRVLSWIRQADVPTGFPIDTETLNMMSYAYIRITETGLERSLFNCREYLGLPAERCMQSRALPTKQPAPLLPSLSQRGDPEILQFTP